MAMALTAEAAVKGARCFWGAPTYDQSRIGWDELQHAASTVAKFNESRMEAKFPNGGIVRFRSLDNPNHARGFTADLWVLEEASYIDPNAYGDVILPTIWGTDGRVWAIYTPNGYDWTHEQEIKAWNRNDSAVFVAPTLGARLDNGILSREPHPLENPEIPWQDIVDAAAIQNEQKFRQEALADRTAREGRVFGTFSRQRHVKPTPILPALDIALAVDFGYRTFACNGVQDTKREETRIFAEGEWHEITVGQAIARIKAWYEWWPRIAYIDCDPAGDGTNDQTNLSDIDLFRKAFPNAKIRYSHKPEHKDTENRADWLRDRQLTASGLVRMQIDPSCESTIRMFEESVYPEHKPGQAEKRAPLKDGKNDHLRDALGYHEVAQFHMRRAQFVAG